MMPCLCGDLRCLSCVAGCQGNFRCEACGRWTFDGGCEREAECSLAAYLLVEALVTDLTEDARRAGEFWADEARYQVAASPTRCTHCERVIETPGDVVWHNGQPYGLTCYQVLTDGDG